MPHYNGGFRTNCAEFQTFKHQSFTYFDTSPTLLHTATSYTFAQLC